MTLAYSLLWRPIAALEAIRGRGYHRVTNGLGTFRVGDPHGLIQFSRFFDPKVKQAVSACRGLFVDVGANIGLYSVLAAKKGCQVVAVEPAEETYRLLLENTAANRLEGRIEAVRAAAWSTNTDLMLSYNDQLALRAIADEGERVHGVTLDSLLHGRKPALIKIDVEGKTAEVVKGTFQTLEEYHPPIIFEARPEEGEMPPVEAALKLLGYRTRRLDRTNWLASVS